MTTNTKSKAANKPATRAKATPAKTAQANNEATAEAKKIKDTAIAEAEQIVADAQAQAQTIIDNANDAKAGAEEFVEKARLSVQDLEQQDKDDASRGDVDPEDDLQPYRNEGKANLFTEGGRCSPNKTVMLTLKQAEQYKGLVPCNTANE